MMSGEEDEISSSILASASVDEDSVEVTLFIGFNFSVFFSFVFFSILFTWFTWSVSKEEDTTKRQKKTKISLSFILFVANTLNSFVRYLQENTLYDGHNHTSIKHRA